ncbi:hypothetical protein K438DRAFT_1852733 [Mycena galopus ATCC 62051]|nr:hypothetical protein K438DRAFT_1852733 [Mycena galopus ATCC 62051]
MARIRPLTLPPSRAKKRPSTCIVGGGHSAAIRLKQLESETGHEVRVIVLENGTIEPWTRSSLTGARTQPVTSSGMRLLTEKYSILIPHPPQMNSKGNYIGA